MWTRRSRSGSSTDVATAFWRTMPRRHGGSGRRRSKGHAAAQFNLGFHYREGRGVRQNDIEAVRWYRLAADQGDADAQNNLGGMYARGDGVPPTGPEALRWWQRAAEQGHEVAQFNLGFMYGNGLGVPQDYRDAVRRYRRAAERGLARARNRLGFAHRDGRTVPHDYVRAHMWLNVVASRATGALRDNAIQGRDRAAEELTADQLAEAQRLAREWLPADER